MSDNLDSVRTSEYIEASESDTTFFETIRDIYDQVDEITTLLLR